MPSTTIAGITMNYLDFQDGSGIRYLMSYQQEGSENTSKELFYTYQGLTTDGTYYVSFRHFERETIFPDVYCFFT